ncbi:Guanylate kinase [uncultured Clostridium sp.]|nr:Guanylate kinase [uncultured Clostridium sp.]
MILILCGPTASGKSTIQKLLCEKYGFHRVVTYTTREPRENEVFGEDYYFVTEDKFVGMVINKEFIESTIYSNNRYYGTSISSIKDADKKDYVAVMTPSGARRMKKYATEHNIPCVVVLLDISLKTKVYRYVQRISDFKMEDLQELYGRCERDYGMFENFDKEVDMTLYNDYYSQEEVAQTIMSQIEEKRAKNTYGSKEIKRVYIDLDNTVFDTLDTILYFYNKEFKYHEGFKEIEHGDVQAYGCSECNLLTKKCLNGYFNRSNFYELTHINTIFWDVLALIVKKGWKPVFVTVGSIPNIAAKKAWFKDGIINHYDATFIGLVDVKDKSSVDMSDSIMIDDHPDMLNSSNAAVKICFGEYGWNKDWEGLRAKNWKEAYKILEDLANER